MAEEKFVIEILLEARNQIGGALEAAGVEVDKLQKKFASATTTAGRLDDRLDKLDRGVGKMGATLRRVNPTLEAFERRALRIAEAAKGAAGGLEKMDRRLEKVNLGLESIIKTIDRAERVITKLEARLDELGLRKFQPEVDVKISGKEKLDALLLELQIATQKVYKAKTDVETNDALNKVEALRRRLHKAGFGDEADNLILQLGIDGDKEAEARLKALAVKADEAARARNIKFTLEGEAHVKSEIQSLLREIEVLKKEDVGINAILKRTQFDNEYDRILADIAILSQSTASPNVKLNKKQYEIEKALLLADLAHLGLKSETVSVKLDIKRGIGDRIAGIGQQIDDAIGDKGLLTSRKLTNAIINLAVAFAEPLLSAVTAVGGGLVALAASAGQAIVGVGGLATAAAAEAAPALGLLAFSLNRVQNVVKAVGLAYKEQQQKGQQQISLDQARAAAADGIRSAEEGVANAQRAVTTAQEALNKARKDGVRQIEDLMLAELRATRQAQNSRLGLAASIATGTGSVIDAQIQAQGDQLTASRATTDSKQAQAGGIEGLDSVISAKRQLADAVRGVADAQRQLDAAGRQAEAASARLIRSANAFQIAYSQLSEGERALFDVLHNKNNTGLLDLFQNNLDSPIRKVTDTVLFSVARMAKGITKLLTDPKIVGAFQSLADSISTVFDGIAKAISSGPVADAIAFFTKESAKNIGPVAHIFGDLLKLFVAIAHAASGPLTSAIGSISGFLDKLVGKVSSPEGQGSLSAWFTAALKPIGSILRLGGAVVNLFLALVGAGGAADAGTKGIDGLTRSIDKATKYINTHSKEVSKFFDDSVKALGYVGSVIVGIGKLLVKTFKSDSVKDFASLINDVVLPTLSFFIQALGLVVKGLASWFRIPILGQLTKFALIAGGTSLIIARLAESISGLLKLFAAEGAIRTFGRWIASTRVATVLAAGAQIAWNVALAAFNLILDANPIILAAAAIIAIGAAFYLAYKKIKPFHDAVDAVFSFIKRHWKGIVEIMLGPLGLIIAGVSKFGPRILHAFKSAFDGVFGFFKALPGHIGNALSDGIHALGSVFEDLGSRIIKGIVRGIKSAPKALLHALESVVPGGKLLGKGLNAIGIGAATGARIGGNPADGDSVHVRVKPGEVILNEIQQRSVGVSAINASLTGAPTISAGGGYATGGKAQRPTSASSTLAAIVNLADNETDDIANNFVTMRKRIEKSLSSLVDSATSNWRDFWKAGDRNLGRLEDSIAKSFKNIGDTVYDGFSYIQDSASKSLKALGGKEAHFGLHRLSLSDHAVSKADGGYIGNQGERGRDNVHTILGRGEAVLNFAHQKIVDPALRAAYGFGLPEMFKRTNALHAGPALGMATGGFAGNVNFFGHPSNVTPTVRRLLGTVEQRWPEATVTSTTDHSVNTTSGNRSLHVDGMAFDIAGEPGYMNRMADWIKSSGIYKNLTEGIHNPNLSVKNGEIVPNTFWGPAVWAQHANHIHLGVRGTVNAFKAASTKIRKQVVTGAGALASVAQRAVNAITSSAQKKVDRDGGGGDTQSQGIKILAASGGRRVGATTFGGPADPGAGVTGYRGDNLHQFPNSYAELSNPGTLDFAALGGLPYKTRLRITAPTGRSAIALKRDVGKGGPSVGGVKRGIDLWYELASKLGLGNVWSGVVKVARAAAGGFVDPGIEWGGAQASGGDYIVKKPTLFLAGEAGHERATFSPIRAAAGFPGYPPLTKPEDFGKPGAFGGSPSLPGAIPQPKPLASPHTYDPPSKPRTTAPTTTTAASSGSGSSSGSSGGSGGSGGGSTQTAASKAAEKAKKAFQKILDDAKKIFEDAAKIANFDQRASLTKATRSVVASFGKLIKKSKDALGALSTAIDYVLTDQNGPIAVIEAIAAARSAVLRRRSTQRQFSVTKNSGGVTAGVRTNAINPQAAELRNLGDDRLGLQAENRILGTVQSDAQKGLIKANKLQSEAEADLEKAKKAKDKKAIEKAKSDLDDAKKLVEDFKQEVNKTRAKREDVRSKLAENAQAIVEQQEALQQTAFDSFTGFFDRLGAIMERTRRRFTARGKEAPLDLFDISIARNTQEIDGLQKQLTKANKSGNKELAKTIQDKIDELQVSIEEIAAQKFQAQIDAVNKTASTKLSANDFSAKLASIGVDPGAFAARGISSINPAQLGQTNYGALGSSLKERGGILQQQRGGLAELLAQAQASGNQDKIDDLTKQIQDLDGSIVDNIKAVRDNTDAALAAAAAARITPLDQNLSISGAGTAYLQSITNNTGISTQAQQAAILKGDASTLGKKQTGDTTSFAEAVAGTPDRPGLSGLVDQNKLATLTGKDLIDYIRGVVGQVQSRPDLFSQDEIATIVTLGTSILQDATAVQDNTKALKDLNGSLVQSFASTGWQRFRQAIFDGNNGLLPQYQSYIPSFSGGGTMMHDGLAMLHRNEVVLTPGEASNRNQPQTPVTEETHFHITSPTEVVDPVWLARQTSFRRRING